MNTTQVPVRKLVHYATNPRRNDHAVDHMASTIREFGFRVPVLVKSDNTIIDGHLRVKAAVKLGLEEIPCVYVDDMTEAQIKAFRLSINRMAELAGWDDELLAVELEHLREMDFDVSLTGLDLEEDMTDVLPNEPPEISENSYKIMIDCLDERDCRKKFEEIKKKGWECRIID